MKQKDLDLWIDLLLERAPSVRKYYIEEAYDQPEQLSALIANLYQGLTGRTRLNNMLVSLIEHSGQPESKMAEMKASLPAVFKAAEDAEQVLIAEIQSRLTLLEAV